MGLPVKKLICASNRNNVLTDFFESGVLRRQPPVLQEHELFERYLDLIRTSNASCSNWPAGTKKIVLQWMQALRRRACTPCRRSLDSCRRLFGRLVHGGRHPENDPADVRRGPVIPWTRIPPVAQYVLRAVRRAHAGCDKDRAAFHRESPINLRRMCSARSSTRAERLHQRGTAACADESALFRPASAACWANRNGISMFASSAKCRNAC
jgi:hypothetical protein